MQEIKRTLSLLVGSAAIAIVSYALFRVLSGGWQTYTGLNDNVQIAIAAGVLSLAGTLFSLFYTRLKEKQLQIEASHREKKQKLYDEYISEVFEIIMKGEGTEDEWFPVRKKFLSNALLWSNPKVLDVFHRMRLNVQDDMYHARDFAKLILAFREDLGLSNRNINEQIILEIMYNRDLLEAWSHAKK